MLGQKERCFKEHPSLSLERLVPKDNFYRQLEAQLDLSFVRDLVKKDYATTMGRPSIDPVVFFKLQLIMFFEGLRSERQLMATVALHLAHRWYLGYDLDEPVPDHSSLSKIRDRYGLEAFERFFEQVVERCQKAGLVWGKELYFDGTKVRANAALNSLEPRWSWQAKQHLNGLFDRPEDASDNPPGSPGPPGSPETTVAPAGLLGLVDKYDGTTRYHQRQSTDERVTDRQVSSTDPDASPMTKGKGNPLQLGYHTQYVVDGGKARIILAALVTPASIMDNTPMLDLARWVRFRWRLKSKIAVADALYGTVENLVGLEQDGLCAYLPSRDPGSRRFYGSDRFIYEAQPDRYICPQGQVLSLFSRRTGEQVFVYRADAALCNACPVKSECTSSKSGRHLFRSFFQEDLDRVAAYRKTAAYQKAMRKRQVWVEPLFGEAKQWHQMVQFRWRGLVKVNIQGLLTAAGQNLKRLLRHTGWDGPKSPAVGVALPWFRPFCCLNPLIPPC